MKLEKKALGFNYFETAFLFKPVVSNVNLHVLYIEAFELTGWAPQSAVTVVVLASEVKKAVADGLSSHIFWSFRPFFVVSVNMNNNI